MSPSRSFYGLSSASLDNTAAWLRAAASEEASAVRARSESPSPDSRGPVSATAVLNRAYMRLLYWDPQDQKYPEVSCRLQNYITLHFGFNLSDILLIVREYSVSLRTPRHPAAMLKHVTTHWSSCSVVEQWFSISLI